MSKKTNAEKAFNAAGIATFETLWNVLQEYVDFSKLTGAQIGKIMNFGYAQKKGTAKHTPIEP